MQLTEPITFLNDPPDAFMLNFAKFPGGALDAIRRIPADQAGIYFWFKTFDYPSDQEGFLSALTKDLLAPKFPRRVGHVQPYYEVALTSSTSIGNKKKNAIDQASKNASFRKHLQKLLNLSVLFQAPLYIGKSNDIKRRMDQHLADDSKLSTRLAEHGLRITDTALLVIPLAKDNSLGLDEMDDELLYEEIFSRLFNPLFNLRLG